MTTDLETALSLAGQGGLATDFIRIGPEAAAQLCRDLYGIEGAFRRLDPEKDDTYLVSAPSGQRFILKIANAEEAEAELDLQLAALCHLADAGFPIPVPRVVAARGGARVSRDPATGRMVRMLSYVEGTPLDAFDLGPWEIWQVGRALGQLRQALRTFRHPAQGRALCWDVQHILTLRPILSQIALTPDHAALAEKAFGRIAALAPRIRALPRQVLHNDLGRSNIVGDPAAPDFVTGIIDFGDVVDTAVAIDVATAVMNQIARSFDPEDDIFVPARPLVAGYLAHAPLTAEERAMIPHLVMARVLVRAVMTEWRAALMPSNRAYILRNTGPSWAQLDWFLSRSPEAVETLLAGPLPEIARRSA